MVLGIGVLVVRYVIPLVDRFGFWSMISFYSCLS